MPNTSSTIAYLLALSTVMHNKFGTRKAIEVGIEAVETHGHKSSANLEAVELMLEIATL